MKETLRSGQFLEHTSVPLDFFSWRCYGKDVNKPVEKSRLVRDLLDRDGYTLTESILDE